MIQRLCFFWYIVVSLKYVLNHSFKIINLISWPRSQKGTLFHKIIYSNTYSLANCHSTILYSKSMKFGIQEELLLTILDIKFHWITPEWRTIKCSIWSKLFCGNVSLIENKVTYINNTVYICTISYIYNYIETEQRGRLTGKHLMGNS